MAKSSNLKREEFDTDAFERLAGHPKRPRMSSNFSIASLMQTAASGAGSSSALSAEFDYMSPQGFPNAALMASNQHRHNHHQNNQHQHHNHHQQQASSQHHPRNHHQNYMQNQKNHNNNNNIHKSKSAASKQASVKPKRERPSPVSSPESFASSASTLQEDRLDIMGSLSPSTSELERLKDSNNNTNSNNSHLKSKSRHHNNHNHHQHTLHHQELRHGQHHQHDEQDELDHKLELEEDEDEIDLSDDDQEQQHQQQHHHHARGHPRSLDMSPPLNMGGQPVGASTSSAGSGTATATNPTASATSGGEVECVLDNKEIWDKFHPLTTEMIITKTGRRMFPVMKVQFHNLNPNAKYAVSMDVVPVDNKRYRYAYHKSCWQVAGKADPVDPRNGPRLYAHPDSPFQGELLAKQVISFEKVKLTNNEMDKSQHLILNSMHKYQPRIHLLEMIDTSMHGPSSSSANHSNHHNNNHNHHHNSNHQNATHQPQLEFKSHRCFTFPETVFIAVTAYQNQLITRMKIDKNPFAKGFRDSSRLSDLDRNDPYDFMGPMGGRFGPGGPAGSAVSALELASAQMDAYQQLASNPWYSAAMAASSGAGNPFGVGPGACSSSAAAVAAASQAAQQFQTQMWLAAFSACMNSSGAPNQSGTSPQAGPPPPGQPTMSGQPPMMPAITANQMAFMSNLASSMAANGSPSAIPSNNTNPNNNNNSGNSNNVNIPNNLNNSNNTHSNSFHEHATDNGGRESSDASSSTTTSSGTST